MGEDPPCDSIFIMSAAMDPTLTTITSPQSVRVTLSGSTDSDSGGRERDNPQWVRLTSSSPATQEFKNSNSNIN